MKSPGRPPLYSEPMKQTAVLLPTEMIEWLSHQPGGMSETIRQMISEKMEAKRDKDNQDELSHRFDDRDRKLIREQLDRYESSLSDY